MEKNMEKNTEKNKKLIQLCYKNIENGIYLTGIYFNDINMLSRFGEWLAIMNETNEFIIHNYETEQTTGVDLEYDTEEPTNQDNKENLAQN